MPLHYSWIRMLNLFPRLSIFKLKWHECCAPQNQRDFLALGYSDWIQLKLPE